MKRGFAILLSFAAACGADESAFQLKNELSVNAFEAHYDFFKDNISLANVQKVPGDKECGGVKPCQCHDTLVADRMLDYTDKLKNCESSNVAALTISSGAQLRCYDETVISVETFPMPTVHAPEYVNDKTGILILGTSKWSAVVGCRIVGFNRAIAVERGAENILLDSNQIVVGGEDKFIYSHSDKYGVYLEGWSDAEVKNILILNNVFTMAGTSQGPFLKYGLNNTIGAQGGYVTSDPLSEYLLGGGAYIRSFRGKNITIRGNHFDKVSYGSAIILYQDAQQVSITNNTFVMPGKRYPYATSDGIALRWGSLGTPTLKDCKDNYFLIDPMPNANYRRTTGIHYAGVAAAWGSPYANCADNSWLSLKTGAPLSVWDVTSLIYDYFDDYALGIVIFVPLK